jgi:putative CocE/NonD family hydrolase
MIWLPGDALENAVPAILEYLPYRKRDGTAVRDAGNHRYFAAHGYACIRVDMRGSGDSEGLLRGEYLKQEQDDALEILRWIAAQPWCTGSIGMIGISWGGFNGLQVAARRPPELKAVISLCSTDDRYDNDVHYMGGCLLVENFLWGSNMAEINPTPPDPAVVGDKWRSLWMKRLEDDFLYMSEWHRRQRRDDFWKHASICEDYSAVQCPVYLVSGWMDPYKNSLFRMLEHLECPKKGLVGPWAHRYPNVALPGPQIGFLQESIRWWDKWLKGIETGIMDEPMLRCYLQDTVPPKTYYDFRPGHWVVESNWPSQRIVPHIMGLKAGGLTEEASGSNDKLSICSPQTVGFASGRWFGYGASLTPDAPGDQRREAGGSLVFDSQPLEQPLDILGALVVHLRIASDKPNALVAATLSEVLPNGSATRLSYGLLNLTHRDSHEDLKPLEPGRFYDVTIKLNECGQRIGAGSRIRLSLSSSYFPITWPVPEKATLTIDCAFSSLHVPTRPENLLDSQLKPFEPAENGPPLRTSIIRPENGSNILTEDLATGEVKQTIRADAGLLQNEDNGWRFGMDRTIVCAVRPDDPLSASVQQQFRKEFGRSGLDLAIDGWTKATVTQTELHLTARVDAWEQGERVFGRDYSYKIPRDHV